MLPMTMRHVKFISRGELHYGVIPEETAEGASPDDQIEVQDAVLPLTWVMRRDECYDVPPVARLGRLDEYEKFIDKAHQSAKRHSDGLRACTVGKLLRFPVADSWAYYVITSSISGRVRLEWRGFSVDRAVEPTLGYEGTMPYSECLKYILIASYVDDMLREMKQGQQPPPTSDNVAD